MNIVTVQGLKGGAGTTTVVANLAAAIHAQNLPVLAIDLCSQNSLRLHFGMPLEDRSGFAVQISSHQPWYEAAYQNPNGISFLPYGQDDGNHCIDAINRYVYNHPMWLKDWLNMLDLPSDTWIIIDCPTAPARINKAALAVADVSLLIATPEALSYATLHSPTCARHLRVRDNPNQLLLLNRYCPSIELERDITSLIKADYPNDLLPITIHRDENLREAFAFKKTVIECSPSSQSAQDFTLAAIWLTARQAHLAEIPPHQMPGNKPPDLSIAGQQDSQLTP